MNLIVFEEFERISKDCWAGKLITNNADLLRRVMKILGVEDDWAFRKCHEGSVKRLIVKREYVSSVCSILESVFDAVKFEFVGVKCDEDFANNLFRKFFGNVDYELS